MRHRKLRGLMSTCMCKNPTLLNFVNSLSSTVIYLIVDVVALCIRCSIIHIFEGDSNRQSCTSMYYTSIIRE